MESDGRFTHQEAFNYFLKNQPDDYDMYAGCFYHGNVGDENKLLNGGSGILTLYIVKQKFYDTFIKMNEAKHLDRSIGEIALQHKIIISIPMVITQPGGYSYNHRRVLFYDKYLVGKQLFNGLVPVLP
jgi:hypothetical protein